MNWQINWRVWYFHAYTELDHYDDFILRRRYN